LIFGDQLPKGNKSIVSMSYAFFEDLSRFWHVNCNFNYDVIKIKVAKEESK